MTIRTIEDALKLPAGILCMEDPLPIMGAHFSSQDVVAAAQLIIDNNDETTFLSQAAVLAHAGNNYGWGVGHGYSAQSPAPRPQPNAPVCTSTVLTAAEDALKLPKGRLVLSIFQAHFGAEDVLSAAQLLIDKGDQTVFTSQAEVIVRAGNHYGWGAGGDYSVF